MHDPDHTEDVLAAQRLGRLRRRRETTVAGAYDLTGLDSIEDIRRLFVIAMFDTLGLDNSVARNRVLIAVASGATKLLEAEELASYSGDLD